MNVPTKPKDEGDDEVCAGCDEWCTTVDGYLCEGCYDDEQDLLASIDPAGGDDAWD